MTSSRKISDSPLILAPAGSRDSFLAAVAADADAVYCGLKTFSARMEAKNFDPGEMARLIAFAHSRSVRVHLALNALIKTDEMASVLTLLDGLNRSSPPDAIIFQDLAMVEVVRSAGYQGEIHLSTLGNGSFPAGLKAIHRLGVDQVVVPRELSVDDIRRMGDACPPGLGLEVFIHGALCYAVSGRCYWSSYLGGRSGLRGRCVQPCRRLFSQGTPPGRHFSCMDFSLDVLVKVLRQIPQVKTWKIEGRKKGPHYVYYTVTAYRMLRDEGHDSGIKKAALDLLSRSLGRPATHYHFLPQRPYNPVEHGETGSGLYMGRTKGTGIRPFIVPRGSLLPGDVLRIGYEDSPGHRIHRMRQGIPARGRYQLSDGKGRPVPKGTPVFLVDRREAALVEKMTALEKALDATAMPELPASQKRLELLSRAPRRGRATELRVKRTPDRKRSGEDIGLWISADSPEKRQRRGDSRLWWVLPPVIWPEEEVALTRQIDKVMGEGGRCFLLNQPWQAAFFSDPSSVQLWAGPFCNISNPAAVSVLADMGFSGVVASPELEASQLLSFPKLSRLPMGVVLSGIWPLCLSRVVSSAIDVDTPFSSPRGEQAWVSRYGGTYWTFPNWRLDLTDKRRDLERAGFRLFLHLDEPVPPKVQLKRRPGIWNWEHGLL
ncbi:MAG: peptidase U32 family protein [Desulfobacterales bacterium]